MSIENDGEYGEVRTPIEERVETDIEVGLKEDFEDGDFEVLTDGPWAEPVSNDLITAVVWRYRTRPKETLIGPVLQPIEITIHGASFVDASGEPLTFRRFIDWHSVYTELGLSGAARIVGEPDSVELDLTLDPDYSAS